MSLSPIAAALLKHIQAADPDRKGISLDKISTFYPAVAQDGIMLMLTEMVAAGQLTQVNDLYSWS